MCVRAAPAFAYRPFDGTDAAVTEPGQAEVELQPAGRLQEGSQSFLVAPGIVINFGVVKGLELVFEGCVVFKSPRVPRVRRRDAHRARAENA